MVRGNMRETREKQDQRIECKIYCNNDDGNRECQLRLRFKYPIARPSQFNSSPLQQWQTNKNESRAIRHAYHVNFHSASRLGIPRRKIHHVTTIPQHIVVITNQENIFMEHAVCLMAFLLLSNFLLISGFEENLHSCYIN